MADDTNKEMNKSENTPDHSSDSEQETWFEGVNKALPEVNLNIFKEAIEIAEQTFKNIKKCTSSAHMGPLALNSKRHFSAHCYSSLSC